MTGESAILEWAPAFAPPPRLLPSEWAEQKFRLPKKSSAKGGKFRIEDTPYLREIIDIESEPGVHKVVGIKGSQIGFTTALQINHGYHMECDPCSMLFILPTMAMVEKWSKTRLDDMIETVPEVAAVINPAKSTLTYKDFEGGSLSLAGANTPNSFAGVDVRIAYGDDVDRFPPVVGDEGDPADLLVNRTDTYTDGLVWFVSTPTLKDGRIDSVYKRSDQRRWFVRCERCGHADYITWSDDAHFRVTYLERDAQTARLSCPKCHHEHDEAGRRRMVRAGAWRATAIPLEPGVVGFHVPTMLSLLGKVTLTSLVGKWLSAVDAGQESLKVFINTQLGEAWEVKGTRMDGHLLSLRKESYGPEGIEIPAAAVAIVAGVDVQGNRLEMMVQAFGHAGERWVIDYRRIPGEIKNQDTKDSLLTALKRRYAHACGADLPIHAVCIDSGDQTDEVYAFVLAHQARRIYATKGIGGRRGEPIVGKPSEKRTGKHGRPVPVFPINVDDAKTHVMSALNQTVAGPNYVHFPAHVDTIDDEFFAQLTAEHKEKVYNKKKIATHEVWVQDRERNEAFDTAVLCLAAFKLLNPNIRQMQEDLPKAQALAAKTAAKAAAAQPPGAPAAAVPPRKISRSGYLDR